MNEQERESLLKNCVAQLVAAHKDFAYSADKDVDSKNPFWIAADTLIAACDFGTIPENCRNLFAAVWGDGTGTSAGSQRAFKHAWVEYRTKQLNSPRPNWRPGQSVWSSYAALKKAMVAEITVPQRELESVADLVKQGVSDVQIAKIYGWRGNMNQPDVDRVIRAKADPEKYNGPETRKPQRKQAEDRRGYWSQYATRLARDTTTASIRARLEMGDDPDMAEAHQRPERMEMGEIMPQLAFGDVDMEFGGPERVDEIGGPITVEQRILMLVDDGMSDADIGSQLGVSGQKIGAVKRRRGEIEPVGATI
jgi:hypothetical protein